MDWTMVRRARELGRGDGALARRARSGLGLIPRRLAGTGEIWRAPLDHADVDARIAQVHRPYHSALSALLDDLRSQWGACLLIDLHSMPPLAPAGAGRGAADYVVGDRFGGSCAAALVADAFDIFARRGAKAAHNRPYAGGYVLDRHAQRLDGVHAIQLEISRATYLDADLWQPGTGLERVADLLAELVRALGERVSRMGGDDLTRAIAAE
jgi:N-formylglutamate amidohydrolase